MREITLQVDLEHPEATDSPYWLIIDPSQNFRTDGSGVHAIASMITGPFFSRVVAESHLSHRKYAFSRNARVYCLSGYPSSQYKSACREAMRGVEV